MARVPPGFVFQSIGYRALMVGFFQFWTDELERALAELARG